MGVNLPWSFARSTSTRTGACALQIKLRSRRLDKKRDRRVMTMLITRVAPGVRRLAGLQRREAFVWLSIQLQAYRWRWRPEQGLRMRPHGRQGGDLFDPWS